VAEDVADEGVHLLVVGPRARIARTSDPDAVRRLEAAAEHDLSVDGPNLAAQAIAAGLVDEYHLVITTSVVGGGSSRTACASISSWSRSERSTAGRSTRATGAAERLASAEHITYATVTCSRRREGSSSA
jgi:riboflavin biosynthesis pyrimidine reductase